MSKISGSEIVIECLKEQGVDTVFGYPGGTILNVYDALYKHQDEINHVLTSHEQGAAHAADGYARATGKVGVCMATSGPGATNLVTGIATAYMDSIPVVAITANVGVNMLGKDSFQEVDIAGVTMPITKHGYIVKNVEILADTIRKAFHIARSGRPGPVLIDITKDVTAAACEYTPMTIQPEERVTRYTREELMLVAEMIHKAKKPYIYLGGGAIISEASAEVAEFAELIDAPVCDTLMGKGAFDGKSERYTGMIGMHGTKTSNLGVSECDLLVALGARFSDRVTGNPKKFAENARIIQLDVDAAEINKNIRVDASLVGDLKKTLTELNACLSKQEHPEWMAHITELKEKYPLKYDDENLSCPYIMQEIDRVTNGEAIITTDVGQHQMWAAQYYKYKNPRTFLSSGGLGTMGYGLPAAIGAAIGNPGREVVCVSGDGGFQMNMQEMATAVCQDAPVIVCILNNFYLGMVRQQQQLFYGKRYSATCLRQHKECPSNCKGPGKDCPVYEPDFVKWAESYGAKGIRVMNTEEMNAAFEEAKKNKKTSTVIEFMIATEDIVLPMVKSGTAMSQMILK